MLGVELLTPQNPKSKSGHDAKAERETRWRAIKPLSCHPIESRVTYCGWIQGLPIPSHWLPDASLSRLCLCESGGFRQGNISNAEQSVLGPSLTCLVSLDYGKRLSLRQCTHWIWWIQHILTSERSMRDVYPWCFDFCSFFAGCLTSRVWAVPMWMFDFRRVCLT